MIPRKRQHCKRKHVVCYMILHGRAKKRIVGVFGPSAQRAGCKSQWKRCLVQLYKRFYLSRCGNTCVLPCSREMIHIIRDIVENSGFRWTASVANPLSARMLVLHMCQPFFGRRIELKRCGTCFKIAGIWQHILQHVESMKLASMNYGQPAA